MSSNDFVESARLMMQERWGRLVKEEHGGAVPEWVPNSRPRELAARYLAIIEWLPVLERELDQATKLLEDLDQRLDGSADAVKKQAKSSRAALDARPDIDL